MDNDWTLSTSKQSSQYLPEMAGDSGYSHGHHEGFADQDNYLLHHLDGNIFDGLSTIQHQVDSSYGTPGTGGVSSSSTSRIDTTPGAFSIENSMFMLPEGVPIEDDHQQQSTAYPPTGGIKTPGLLANKHLVHDSKTFMSPVLPGQNEKSYNDQHYYHTHRSSVDTTQHQPPSQHVRPDAVFTPLVSPAVTPHDSQVNANKQTAPVLASFEPLTSPALNARPDVDRRRSSSSAYVNAEEQSSHKRRTPHGTPVMAPNGSSRGVKQSPSLKGRSHRSGINGNSFEKLPESLVAPRSSGESTPMYPPLRKQVVDYSNGDGAPAMMGFTMGRLSEQQPHGHNRSSSSSANTSPVISTQGSKSRSEKPDYKRTSHKIAEQGRRNRMNTAVQELAALIPPSFTSEESVPSKANTVELASKYIRSLLDEIEDLRRK